MIRHGIIVKLSNLLCRKDIKKMLRQLQTVNAKCADALSTAGEALKVGMLVTKDSDGEAVLLSADGSTDLFFVVKEKIPTGLNSIQGEISEYDNLFNDIADGERVVLIKPVEGEKYATDQFVDTKLIKGYPIHANTDGKIVRINSGTTSMVYDGAYVENDRTLAKVRFIESTTFAETRSNEALITAFGFEEQTAEATIDAENGTIDIEVAKDTDVETLVATFELSTYATVKVGTTAQVSGTTDNDFTNPVVYVVTAEDTITTKNWTITVTVATE